MNKKVNKNKVNKKDNKIQTSLRTVNLEIFERVLFLRNYADA